MRFKSTTTLSAFVALAGCQDAAPQRSAPRQEQAAAVRSADVGNQESVSLKEPNGPIDPTSVEAAGQLVQSYGALAEQGRWTEANAMWGDSQAAAKFEAILVGYSEVHLEIGNPGEPEGAAGSIYLTIPVILYGDGKDGQPFRSSADVILRRVNDVAGSTDAQRRWHIERIDFAP
jgi:hypothetical protein